MNYSKKPKFYMEPDFESENGSPIESVGDYINKINETINFQENKGRNEIMLFRGQKTDFWPVNPSIFRDNYLSVEHDLLQQPLEKLPHEFKHDMDIFEMMAKCQHYGLCTRLLDLTTNPLVALYFACETFGEVEYRWSPNESGEEKEPYGIVYYKWNYPLVSTYYKVRIISAMARMNLNHNNKLEEILNSLYKQSIISEDDRRKWTSCDGYKEFVNIIQSDYIVRPIYSNDRLIKQSGMFMLTGCFNVNGNDPSKITIEKSKSDFKETFDGFFYVSGNIKDSIMQELDRCNINESTLFPELEHQLNYIKRSKKEIGYSSDFIKCDEIFQSEEEDCTSTAELDFVNFETKVKNYLNDKYEKKLSDGLWSDIKKTMKIVDWYQRDPVKSSLLMKMTKRIISYGKKETAKDEAKAICEFITRMAIDN